MVGVTFIARVCKNQAEHDIRMPVNAMSPHSEHRRTNTNVIAVAARHSMMLFNRISVNLSSDDDI